MARIKECEACGASLKNAIHVLPWEDGDNADGYYICPQCGHKTFEYEDDD